MLARVVCMLGWRLQLNNYLLLGPRLIQGLLPLQTQDHKVLAVGVHLSQLLHSRRLGIAQHQSRDLIDAPMPRVALGAVFELDVDVLLFDAHD